MPTRRRLAVGIALALVVVLVGYLLLTAEQRALAAEEEYVVSHLEDEDCLETWGANEGAGSTGSAITGVTLGGVRVNVTMPYAYSVQTEEGPLHADLDTRASYEVTLTDVRRISGDDVAPC